MIRERKTFSVINIIKNEYFLYVVSIVLFLLSWHAAATSAFLGPSLATPLQTAHEIGYLMHTSLAGNTLIGQAWASTHRVLIGFALGSIVAVPLGLFMALNRYVDAIVKPVFDIFKPMPPIAWISISILWFGVGETSKDFIIFIGAFVPALLNAYNGIRLIEPELYDVIRVLGGNRRDEIFQVSFPASFPAIFAGLQIALSSSWTCVIAAELVCARSGLGWLIIRGMQLSKPSLVLAGMIMIAMAALLTTLAVTLLERVLCPWKRAISQS